MWGATWTAESVIDLAGRAIHKHDCASRGGDSRCGARAKVEASECLAIGKVQEHQCLTAVRGARPVSLAHVCGDHHSRHGNNWAPPLPVRPFEKTR